MKNMLLGTSRICFAPDDGTGSGGGSSNINMGLKKPNGSADNTGGNNGANNASGDDNLDKATQNFLDTHKDLWDTPEGEGNTDNNNNSNNDDALASKRKKFDDYINGMEFGLNIDMQALTDSINNNDPKALNEILTGGLRNTYRRVMNDVTRLLSAAEERMQTAMDNIANTKISARDSERSLMEAVPAANKPAVRPIALAIKQKFLEKGASDTDANQKVKDFFKALRKSPDDDFGLSADDDDATRQRFQRGRNKPAAEDIDWASLLGGKR